MKFETKVFPLMLLTVIVGLTGCGDETTNQYITEEATGTTGSGGVTTAGGRDTDNDGLSDAEEEMLGTSPILKDTDGDGFDDFQEAVVFGFNSNNNNYRFNPLIADVAKIGIEITSVPLVSLNYKNEFNITESRSNERVRESAQTTTVNDTSSNSRAIEETHSVGVSYSASATIGLTSAEVTAGYELSYDYSHSTTNESSFSHSEEQSEENRLILGETEEEAISKGFTEEDGSLAVSVRIYNDSDIAFQLKNLTIGAVTLSGQDRRAIAPVANLSLDTASSTFPAVTIAPGDSTGELVFDNTITFDTAKTLLSNPQGFIVKVAASEIVDSTGTAFTFRETEINTKTATVIIDFGGYKPSERYLVATNVNQTSGTVALQSVLSDILQIPYELDNDNSMDSIRGLASDLNKHAFWVGVHISSNGLTPGPEPITLSSERNNGDLLESLVLKSGDVIQFTYLEDEDGDGVGLRSERLFGTDPTNEDTDTDGLLDGVELEGFALLVNGPEEPTSYTNIRSNPLLLDSDGDTLNDNVECDFSTKICTSNPNNPDTDGDRIPDAFDTLPADYTSIELINVSLTVADGSAVPVLDFTLPNIPDMVHKVYRKRVENENLADLCNYGVTDCTYTDVTASLTQPDLLVSRYILSDSAGANFDQFYQYQIVAEINGSNEIFLGNNIPVNTSADSKIITVALTSLQGITCWDEIGALYSDGGIFEIEDTCQLFGNLLVSYAVPGEDIVIATEVETLSVVTGSNPSTSNFQQASVSVTVPDVPGICIYIKPRLWEKEDAKVDSTTDDDRLVNPENNSFRAIGSVHCQTNNWNPGQQIIPMAHSSKQDRFSYLDSNNPYTCGFFDLYCDDLIALVSENYEGLYENIELEVVYNVTATDP